MNILLVGQNMAKYNPTSLTDSFYRGLIHNNVRCNKYDLTLYITNNYFNYIVKKTPLLREKLLIKTNELLLDFLSNNHYTHLFVVKGTFLLPDTLMEIKKIHPEIKLCCFNPDDPFNNESWGGSNHANIKESISYYDYYFIWSKGLIKKIKAYGVKNVNYRSIGFDNSVIKKFNNIPLKYNLSFIGNSDNERQAWINRSAELIAKNSLIKNIDVFGLYWNNYNNITLNGGRYGENYFKVFYESKININILRNQNKGETNMRTFEIPATGNFMLHENSDAAKEFFKEDIDAVYFNSPEELVDKSEYYLKNESLRLKIAQSGYEKSLKSGYTYNDKVKEIIKIIK